ncbi:MAG: DUF523 domain-containing protein [Pseudobdellovibrionaceae bacterium]
MKIGVSHCLLGSKCNFNGKDLLNEFVKQLEDSGEIEFVPFCPEDSVFGSPRPNLRIVGGDGFDVLDGRAKVIDELGNDVTESQIEGANRFLAHLNSNQVTTAILMDGSPSCGSNVLLKEDGWPMGGFKKGIGVTTALLKRNNVAVLSSFDELDISTFIKSTVPSTVFPLNLKNLRDLPKFKSFFEIT